MDNNLKGVINQKMRNAACRAISECLGAEKPKLATLKVEKAVLGCSDSEWLAALYDVKLYARKAPCERSSNILKNIIPMLREEKVKSVAKLRSSLRPMRDL